MSYKIYCLNMFSLIVIVKVIIIQLYYISMLWFSMLPMSSNIIIILIILNRKNFKINESQLLT